MLVSTVCACAGFSRFSVNSCTFGNFRIRNTSQYIGRGLVSMTASSTGCFSSFSYATNVATSGNDTCFSAFQGLETLGLPLICGGTELGPPGLSTNWFWEELSSAVCSGPPELPFVSERSGRARFFNKKKRW